jgi:phage baseplate assembly protein W
MLIGSDRHTGEELTGPERARQSIASTISTPFLSQPGHRAYGNDMPELISAPFTKDNIMRAYAALVDAFSWEPEAELLTYGLTSADELGRIGIGYQARYIPTDEIFTDIIARNTASFEADTTFEVS